MIAIEEQVLTLPQAKNLKELGIKPTSIFYWINCYSGEPIDKWKIVSREEWKQYGNIISAYPAFSISEMAIIVEKLGLHSCSYGWSRCNKDYGEDERFGFFCTGGFGCGEEVKCSGLSIRDMLYRLIYCQIKHDNVIDINNIIANGI